MVLKKPLVGFAVFVLLIASLATPVTAHDTQNVEGYEITFGGAEEPLITNERMWLELTIIDNETGEPVANQAETLTVSVQTSESNKTALELGEKHGEPGVYEAPVIFTEAGDYVVHLEGSLEGTEIHTHFEKEVHDHSDLQYPNSESQMTDNSDESQTNINQIDESGFNSFSIVIIGVSVVAALGALLLRTRR